MSIKRVLLFFLLIQSLFVIATVKPNIILIQADDLGWDDLGIHGNPYIETPALDGFAQGGIQFTNYYVNSVCAPTRASLLTGRHFLRTGVSHVHGGKDFINLKETLLSETLKENGYKTGFWGKWHSGHSTGYFPWERGFDEAYMAALYKHKNSFGSLNDKDVKHQKWASEVITDYAINFIQQNKEQPFFAYLSYLTPHGPLVAPDGLIEKYKSKGLSKNLSTLYAMIEQMDSCINRLLIELDKNDLTENTIILFMSDNGPAFIGGSLNDEDRQIRYHSEMKGHKGNLWENGVRSPLFIFWPKQLSSSIDNRLIDVTDIYPTLVDLAGGKKLSKQLPLDGKSFVDYFSDTETVNQKQVFNYVHVDWANHFVPYDINRFTDEYNPYDRDEKLNIQVDSQMISIRQGDFKLLKNGFPVRNTNFEDYNYLLFNIEEDRTELNDLKKEYPQKYEEMKAELDSWYLNILLDDHSLTSPVFFINSANSTILGKASQRISDKLVNAGFFLTGWNNANQKAEYNIEVTEEGWYNTILEFSEFENESEFKVKIGEKSVNSVVKEKGKTTLGKIYIDKGQQRLVVQNAKVSNKTKLGSTRLMTVYLEKISNEK